MNVRTYKAASMFLGENWCAKCSDCGAVLTKYCHDEGEARREAEASGHHLDCGKEKAAGFPTACPPRV